MSFWSGTKRTAKYVVWGMPSAILGVPMLRLGSRQIRDLYRSLTWPVCPHCQNGTLIRGEADDPTAVETSWYCRKCKSTFTAPVDPREANLVFSAARRTAAVDAMAHLADTSRADLMRRHRWRSRWYFGMAALFLVSFLVNIALGAGFMALLNWLILTSVMFIFGLKASYRCWQVTYGVVFEPGAFRRWFWRGRWFV
ncbi:MAG: hypothetical protein WC617_12540 [Rhodanobacter sp.]|jgi:hypothetical protein